MSMPEHRSLLAWILWRVRVLCSCQPFALLDPNAVLSCMCYSGHWREYSGVCVSNWEIVSFRSCVRRAVSFLCRLKSEKCRTASWSFIFCLKSLYLWSSQNSREFPKRVLQESSPREFSKRVCKDNSRSKFWKRVLRKSYPREFSKRV